MLSERERNRYERQLLFRPLGAEGQERLKAAMVVIAGVGAIGAMAANMLARGGVGTLRLVDFDCVELSNLQRQMLYDEEDVAQRRPKAEVAAERLRRANSDISVQAAVAKVTGENAAELIAGADVVLDAVDNFRAKWALNAACLEAGVPLVYAALSGSYGLVHAIIPGETACLCCLYCEEPDAGSSETAATAGVIGPTVATVAALQVSQAMKLLIGARDDLANDMIQVDVWDMEINLIPAPRKADCAACGCLSAQSC